MANKTLIIVVIVVAAFVIFAFSPFSRPVFELVNKLTKIDTDNEENYRYIIGIIWIISASICSRVCYVKAKRLNKDPMTWAMRGFISQFVAIAYLSSLESGDKS